MTGKAPKTVVSDEEETAVFSTDVTAEEVTETVGGVVYVFNQEERAGRPTRIAFKHSWIPPPALSCCAGGLYRFAAFIITLSQKIFSGP